MQPLFKNILKSTLVGAVAGALLSQVLPHFAVAIGIGHAVGELGNPVWMAGFFGAISGVTTAVQPFLDTLFKDTPADSVKPEPCVSNNLEFNQSHQINLAAHHSVNNSFSAVAAENLRRNAPPSPDAIYEIR